MQIEYHSKLRVDFSVNPNKGRRWQLIEPFSFSVDSQEFTVPVGFWTDFASVPRIIWPIISPYELGYGPIPHDFGYFTGIGNKDYWDLVLLSCMELDKIKEWRRNAAYRAVQWFAGGVWNKYRSQGKIAEQMQRLQGRTV